jgi:hypothetical protein
MLVHQAIGSFHNQPWIWHPANKNTTY